MLMPGRFILILFAFLPQIQPKASDDIQVTFSPNGGCTEAIVREIKAAKQSIQIQAYSFTSQPIAKALIDAQKRGVKIRAILDKSNRTDRYSAATFLLNQKCDVFIDDKHQIAHNKIIIIDEAVIITGSFNFSKAAEQSNAENLLVIRSHPELVKQYLANWDAHLKHSQPYSGPATSQPAAAESDKAGESANAGTTVYVTKSGKKYHSEGCRSLNGGGEQVKLSQAKAKGKTACKICHPPE